MNFFGRPYTGGSTQQPQMSLASLGQQVSQPQRPAAGGNPWGGSMGGVMNPQGGYQWGGGQGMGGGIWGNRGGFAGPPAAQGGINYGMPQQAAAPAQAVQGGVNFGNPADQPIRAIDGVVAGNAPGMPSFNAGTGGSIWPNQQFGVQGNASSIWPQQEQLNAQPLPPQAQAVGGIGNIWNRR